MALPSSTLSLLSVKYRWPLSGKCNVSWFAQPGYADWTRDSTFRRRWGLDSEFCVCDFDVSSGVHHGSKDKDAEGVPGIPRCLSKRYTRG